METQCKKENQSGDLQLYSSRMIERFIPVGKAMPTGMKLLGWMATR